jgi:hypothetical protein
MGLFEFLMVLVSIIVGLGLTEILTGVARSIRCRTSVEAYWVHSILVIALFIALLQQWWEIWGLRDTAEWSFLALLIMLAAPVCLFLSAHLVFPEPVEGKVLRDYYYEEMRPIWILGALAVVASTSFRPLIFGDALFSPDNATSFIGLAGFVTLFVSKRRAFHAIFLPVLLILLLADIFFWTPVIAG